MGDPWSLKIRLKKNTLDEDIVKQLTIVKNTKRGLKVEQGGKYHYITLSVHVIFGLFKVFYKQHLSNLTSL